MTNEREENSTTAGVALAFFWLERVASGVIALGLLLALAFTGLLAADQAFAGFGSERVIIILGLLGSS